MLIAPLLSAAALGLASVPQAAAYPLYTRSNTGVEPVHPDAATNGTSVDPALNASSLFNTRDGYAVLASNFSQIVMFGDSLSDNGTGLGPLTGFTSPDPLYYDSFRFSNGMVWPQYLARRMGIKLRDFATGGSTTSNDLNPAVIDLGVANLTIPSALDQIAAYLAENTTTPESLASSLHIIFTGGNDALAVLSSGGRFNITGQQLTQAVAGGVQSLQAAGAAAITLVNLPSLDDTPASRVLTPATSQALDVITSSYRDGLMGLESDNVTNADPYQGVNLVRANAEAYGFNSTTFVTPCQIGLSTLEQSLGFQYSKCKDQDSYVYWDSVHLTTAGHKVFASIVAGALTAKGWVTTL